MKTNNDEKPDKFYKDLTFGSKDYRKLSKNKLLLESVIMKRSHQATVIKKSKAKNDTVLSLNKI